MIKKNLSYRSNSNTNSLQPFQSVMYPSAIAPLLRTGSTPDLSSDPICLEVKGMTEKLSRTRNFWSHGLKTAASSLIKIPPPESFQQQFQTPQPSSSTGIHEPFILNPARVPSSQQFHLQPPTNLFSNFPSTSAAQQPESPTLNDSLDQDSISSEATTVIQIQSSQKFPSFDIEIEDLKEEEDDINIVVADETSSIENTSTS